MTTYIDKDALVAKTDNILDYIDEHWDTDYAIGAKRFADKLQDAIDTLEVKEVDLEKLSNVERIGKDWKEEPVSEELEKEVDRYVDNHYITTRSLTLAREKLKNIARHFANWQKEQMMAKGVDGVVHRFDGDGLAAIHYNDPKGVPMCYYTSPSGLEAGDKVKLILAKEG